VPSLKQEALHEEARSIKPQFPLALIAMVLAAAMVVSSCGGGGSQRSPDPGGVSIGADSGHALRPVVSEPSNRSMVIDSLDRSLSQDSAVLIRRAAASYTGMEVESVDRLIWESGSGRTTAQMMVDEKYLTNQEMRDYIDSINRDLGANSQDLDPQQLSVAFDGVRRDLVDMLDYIESDGSGIAAAGLGFWTGSSGGIGETQQLSLRILDDKLESIEFSVEVAGSTITDSWEFTS